MARRLLAAVGKNWFLAGMAAAVLLATAAPGVGRTGGPLHAELATTGGVFLIFFLHGIWLAPAALRAGAARWRLHVFVQVSTFVAFPLLGLATRSAAGRLLPPDLVLGVLFLCALPSTITSSVALTGVARGNVVGALFNASLSSLLGVLVTPLLVAALVGGSGALALGPAMARIGKLIVAPLLLGQALRPLVGERLARWRKAAGLVDRLVVLSIVWVSFCDAVAGGLWTRFRLGTIAATAGCALALLLTALVLTWRGARLLRFPVEDEIAAVFCGSVKALAIGVPMANAMFAGSPVLGAIVLPIMFYHPLQLLLGSVLAERYARRAPGAAAATSRPGAASPARGSS